MKNNIKKPIFLIIVFTIFFAISYYFNLLNLLNIEKLGVLLDSGGVFAPLLFIFLFAVLVFFFLPLSPVVVVGGVFFGVFFGAIYSLVGAIIGASFFFLFVRYFGQGFVVDFLERRNSLLKNYDVKLKNNGFFIIFTLRALSIFPFSILTASLAITRVRFVDFFTGTLLGVIPSFFILSYFGSSVVKLNLVNILVSSFLFLFIIIFAFTYKRLKN